MLKVLEGENFLLNHISEQDVKFNVFLGFDGFIDKILKPIKIKSGSNIVPFGTIKEFSGYLGEKSGKSCSIDLETLQEKIGGNMPIAANALGNLGCQAICVGAMGFPEINPIFRSMSNNCLMNSVSEPGYCNSLEFEDGKLMLATATHIDRLDYKKLISRISEEALVEYFNDCDAAAFLNWGELIRSNDIWENILRYIIPKCTFCKKKIMLVDFSDFSKRKKAEVIKMLALLKGYSNYFDITVSLNENELSLFFDKLNLGECGGILKHKIIALSKWFACKHFVVHLLDSSKYVKDGSVYSIEKEVIQEPKIITGGGDNFNAGLLFGLLLGLQLEDAIRVGAGLSCLYVRDAKTVSFQKLMDYAFHSQIPRSKLLNI